jgi:protein ImuB
MRLKALNRAALEAGLGEGQTLADARALCSQLVSRPLERGRLMAAFGELADWLTRFSPLVAIHDAAAPMGDMVLDITGVSHLFGGEAGLLEAVTGRLEAEGLSVSGAVAGSVGAAWALSRFGKSDTWSGVLAAGEENEALADLPVMALRIDDQTAAGLAAMGLKRVGDLYGRDRRALKARFGEALLSRLDQALGHAGERIVPRLPAPERMVERRFGEPIGLVDDVLAAIAGLAGRLCAALEEAREGAQTFHLFLYRVDHKLMHLAVNAASATREAPHVARLFGHRLERLQTDFDAGFGIDMMRLAATSVSRLDEAQLGAFEAADSRLDLDRFYDRVTSRFGPAALARSKFADTHIPERAVSLEPVVARSGDEPGAAPGAALPRPLRLLPVPEEVTVVAEVPEGPPGRMRWRRVGYRFVRVSGPERIGVEWWRPGEGALTRDYYVAEDDQGRRFWLFREGLYDETAAPRWFLHGLFA